MNQGERSLLCIDMAYTMRTVRSTNRYAFCNARHFLGVFRKVYAVHPLADVAGGLIDGGGRVQRISRDQIVIEGEAFRYAWPSILAPVNFLVSQLSLLVRLARLVRSREIDAIYATDPYYSGLIAAALKLLTGRKTVVLVAANFDEIYEATGSLAYPRLFRFRWVENAISHLVLRTADLVAGGNRNNLDCALNHGARRTRSTIFTSALLIDANHQVAPEDRDKRGLGYVFRKRPWLSSKPRLLFIGRLHPMKLPEDAVAAMELACLADPEVVGVLAGEGPLRKDLETRVRERGLEDRIVFAGNVEQKVLAALIPGSIIVSPLTGMALIEAGLGGGAIVAYDRDWQADFVTQGVDGFVVPFRDIDALAAHAIRLVHDSETRTTFARRIREKSLELTSIPKLRRHFEEQWARILV